jgi:hypothetical protein
LQVQQADYALHEYRSQMEGHFCDGWHTSCPQVAELLYTSDYLLFFQIIGQIVPFRNAMEYFHRANHKL